MDLAFGFLMLLWGLLGRGRTTPELAPRMPGRRPSPAPATGNVSTPAWPTVVPSDLPPFPGSGWEPDEPPPKAVQQRAGALISSLWAKGQGTYKIEQTAGRWIAYTAGITVGNKHGVIAYRLKRRSALPAPARAPRVAPGAAGAARPPDMLRPPSGGGWPGRPPGSLKVSVVQPTEVPGGSVTPKSPTELRVLRYGDGLKPKAPVPEVELVQQKLGLKADGRFGKNTRSSVVKFQTKQVDTAAPGWSRSDIDGVVGPQTWKALFPAPLVRA